MTYDGYKAKREAMPRPESVRFPTFAVPLKLPHPILEAEGFEADDVIGTLGCRASRQGYDVFIVSGDKDMSNSSMSA